MNILEKAQEFYKNRPLPQVQDNRRKLAVKQLLLVIETAPFLSPNEKKQMSELIPIYTTGTIKNVRRSLVQQGFNFLRLNPDFKESISNWLNSFASN